MSDFGDPQWQYKKKTLWQTDMDLGINVRHAKSKSGHLLTAQNVITQTILADCSCLNTFKADIQCNTHNLSMLAMEECRGNISQKLK